VSVHGSEERLSMYSLRVLKIGEATADALERIRREGDVVVPAHDPRVLARYPDGVIA